MNFGTEQIVDLMHIQGKLENRKLPSPYWLICKIIQVGRGGAVSYFRVFPVLIREKEVQDLFSYSDVPFSVNDRSVADITKKKIKIQELQNAYDRVDPTDKTNRKNKEQQKDTLNKAIEAV